jgi:hypothetical protein
MLLLSGGLPTIPPLADLPEPCLDDLVAHLLHRIQSEGLAHDPIGLLLVEAQAGLDPGRPQGGKLVPR